MSRRPAPRRTQALRTLLGSPAARPALDELGTPLPDDVAEWLGQLALLEAVPFNCLVPDPRMLPPESIRFFYLDDNWMDALRDGALSVVDLSQQDAGMLAASRSRIDVQTHAAAAALRARRRARARRRTGFPAPAETALVDLLPTPPARPWTGMLLRSAIVSDWPGVAVAAYSDEAGTTPVQLLRIDRPAPTVLLAIFGGVVQQVTVAKPAQGLHFGVVEDAEGGDVAAARRLRRPGDPPPTYVVYLRGLGGGFDAGTQLPDRSSVEVPMRADPGGRMVLDVGALADALTAELTTQYDGRQPPPQPLPLQPGGFGVQLVAGAELQAFVPHPTLVAPAAPAPQPRPEPPAGRVSVADLMEVLRRAR